VGGGGGELSSAGIKQFTACTETSRETGFVCVEQTRLTLIQLLSCSTVVEFIEVLRLRERKLAFWTSGGCFAN
jgi:hypothetical protein